MPDPAPEYVSLDPDGEIIRLRLPAEHEPYRTELLADLVEEFAFEPRTKETETRLNEYVREWLGRRQGGSPPDPAGPGGSA